MAPTSSSLRQSLSRCLPFFFLLPLLWLAACADMSGIQPKAELQTPASLDQARLSASGAEAAEEDWWRSWNDPQLNRLMSQALAGNPSLKVARARIDHARATVGLAESQTRPGLSANGSFIRERFSMNQFFPPPIGGNVYWNNEATLNLSYDLDLWGQQESIVAAVVDEAKAAVADAWQVRLALATAVAQAYAQWAIQGELADLAREEKARLERALNLARRREKAGLEAGKDADNIAIALARQQAQVEALDTTVILARHQLAALAGLGPQAGDGLQRPALASADVLTLPAHLPAALVGRRPDVIAQRWRVEAAGQRIDAAKAAFYPNIDLMAFVGFQALGFTDFLDGSSGIHGFGPALSLPIFDGGRRRSRLGQETAAYDGAVEAYNGTLIRALQSVADRIAELESNRKESVAARQALTAAQRRLKATEQGWKAGVSTYQGVLDAQATVLASREMVARLEAARRQAYAGLMLAIGGQWSSAAPLVDGEAGANEALPQP